MDRILCEHYKTEGGYPSRSPATAINYTTGRVESSNRPLHRSHTLVAGRNYCGEGGGEEPVSRSCQQFKCGQTCSHTHTHTFCRETGGDKPFRRSCQQPSVNRQARTRTHTRIVSTRTHTHTRTTMEENGENKGQNGLP